MLIFSGLDKNCCIFGEVLEMWPHFLGGAPFLWGDFSFQSTGNSSNTPDGQFWPIWMQQGPINFCVVLAISISIANLKSNAGYLFCDFISFSYNIKKMPMDMDKVTWMQEAPRMFCVVFERRCSVFIRIKGSGIVRAHLTDNYPNKFVREEKWHYSCGSSHSVMFSFCISRTHYLCVLSL